MRRARAQGVDPAAALLECGRLTTRERAQGRLGGAIGRVHRDAHVRDTRCDKHHGSVLRSSGSAFWTVKKVPRALTLKVLMKTDRFDSHREPEADARPDAETAPQGTVAIPTAFTNDLRSVSIVSPRTSARADAVSSHRVANSQRRVRVVTVGLIVRLEAKPGKQEDVAVLLSGAASRARHR